MIMAAPMLFCVIPLIRTHLRSNRLPVPAVSLLTRRPCCWPAAESALPEDKASSAVQNAAVWFSKDSPNHHKLKDDPDYGKWKDKEAEILRDIEPITVLTKAILHSGRYMDGDRLTAEDEKAVVEKLLFYHPHSEDKIGCGLDSIMVDRHPQFRKSRCLFVVRTDGVWIDFSYQKCLRSYLRQKYPPHAERFINEHYKRGSS